MTAKVNKNKTEIDEIKGDSVTHLGTKQRLRTLKVLVDIKTKGGALLLKKDDVKNVGFDLADTLLEKYGTGKTPSLEEVK